MKVRCLRSSSGPGITLIKGKEYDLTTDQIKAVGAVNLEALEKPKPKAKPIAKGPRKAK